MFFSCLFSPDFFNYWSAFHGGCEFDNVDVLFFEFKKGFFSYVELLVGDFELFWCECVFLEVVVGSEGCEEPDFVFACVDEVDAVVEWLYVGFEV